MCVGHHIVEVYGGIYLGWRFYPIRILRRSDGLATVRICFYMLPSGKGDRWGGEHWELMIVRYGLAVIAVGRAEIDVDRKVPS